MSKVRNWNAQPTLCHCSRKRDGDGVCERLMMDQDESGTGGAEQVRQDELGVEAG